VYGVPVRKAKKGNRKVRVVGLSRKRPEFSKPLSGKGASFLEKKTKEWDEQRQQLASA